ncbi:MAG: heparan-alpha-glucosaminide N-acetyltransferase domain-containing protein, partial [Pseudonocardiaceae bacterium]
LAAGRSATMFVLVAGVSLAFLSGGRRVVEGRTRTAAAAGIAVRALLIGAIGLWLSSVVPQVDVILPHYAVLFFLAIPLLGLRPRTLTLIVIALIAVAPLVVLAGRLFLGGASDPTLDTLVDAPSGLIVGLLVTGTYPALAYLAYLCAGLALGRLDLSSRRVAAWLFGGGLGLAVTARIVSDILLFRLGGLQHLLDADLSGSDLTEARNVLLWEPEPTSSWWYLALPAPHSTTPVDMAHTLGSAMAVLGAALLLSRVAAVARLLRPLAAAGAMTLTLYCGHLLVLATGVLDDEPEMLFVLMAVGALAFGAGWQRRLGQGPLERLVAATARQARRAVASRSDRGGSRCLVSAGGSN